MFETHPALRPRRQGAARGFSLVELLITVVIMGIIALAAYPAMSTFSDRNADASASTQFARLFNKARAQAQRRNRAYIVRLAQFSSNSAAGAMEIREGLTGSCQTTAANLDAQSRLITVQGFGRTNPENVGGPQFVEPGQQEETAGLRSWRLRPRGAGPGGEQALTLALCIGPDGSTSRLNGALLEPVDGLQVLVQRFERGADGAAIGPPREVEISFAGGARIELR